MKNKKISWYVISIIGALLWQGTGFIRTDNYDLNFALGVIAWAGMFVFLFGIAVGIYEGVGKLIKKTPKQEDVSENIK